MSEFFRGLAAGRSACEAGVLEVRLALVSGWIAALVLGVVVLILASDAQRLPSGGRGVGYLGVALAWGFVAVGSYATLRRPDRRTGVLMIAVGLATLLAGLQFSDAALSWLVGVLTDTLVLAVFVHLLLAFPSGRLESVGARLVVGGGYLVATLLQLPPLLFGLSYNCAGSACPRNLLRIAREPDVAAGFATAQMLAVLAVIVCALAVVAQRWRAANTAQRQSLEPVLGLGAVIVSLGAVAYALEGGAAQLLFLSALALLPLAFLAGLVRGRFFRTAAVGRLIGRLSGDAGAAQAALRDALGDPTLAIAYRLAGNGRHVDTAGRPLALPAAGAGRVATEIDVGALIHDRRLCETPELLRDAAAAAALALENGRLEVELRAQVEALRASRARLVETGDAERRRLTRDLHDGAQQRLVSLLLGLQVARGHWETDPDAAREALDEAFVDARLAVDELRELASGIHPAVLTQRGLDAALESLATRAAVPVVYKPGLEERFPAAVESAAYFVVAEGLANVAKHAEASFARVEVRRVGPDLLLTVSDDGAGGADAARGSGLRGLEDRLGALDGRLEVESPCGGGTRLTASVPIASPAQEAEDG
jgi:signal transduction histidine kinase